MHAAGRDLPLADLIADYERLRKEEKSAVRKRRAENSLKPLQVDRKSVV